MGGCAAVAPVHWLAKYSSEFGAHMVTFHILYMHVWLCESHRLSHRRESSRRGPATPPGASRGTPTRLRTPRSGCARPPRRRLLEPMTASATATAAAAASEGRWKRRAGRLRNRHRVFWRPLLRRRLRTRSGHRHRCSRRPGSRLGGRSGRSSRLTRPARHTERA